MHGVIFYNFRRFLDKKLGSNSWNVVLQEANLRSKVFLATHTYPDEDFLALLSASAKYLKKDVHQVLEEFGVFIAQPLLDMYHALIKPEWTLYDLIENTENTIHKVVRIRNPGAEPPELKCERPAEDHVVIYYSSPRKICSLLKGIAQGLAQIYQERIQIIEDTCMLKAAPECTVHVKRRNL